VLLDDSVPRQLGAALVGHSVATVPKQGWAGLRNGELLPKAAPCSMPSSREIRTSARAYDERLLSNKAFSLPLKCRPK